VQTYARSARAFFHWLVRRETIERNPFDRIVFPKVGRPLIQTIEPEEFERLLHACVPPNETGPIADQAAVRNRAILWLLYDTGIRVSELCGLRVGDFDRRHGVITVTGKGSKERRVALGQNCLRRLLYYLDRHRPDEEELAEWGSAGEGHLPLLSRDAHPAHEKWHGDAVLPPSQAGWHHRQTHQSAHSVSYLRRALPRAGQ